MQTVYKLTSDERTTHEGFQWPYRKWCEEAGGVLCAKGLFHAYRTPLQAAFFAPLATAEVLSYRKLWEAHADGDIKEAADKVGATRMRLWRRVELPTITTERRVRAAIAYALCSYDDPKYRKWADKWLGGSDRSAESAESAAWSAAWSAAASAAWSASSAASAALSAESARSAAESILHWAVSDAPLTDDLLEQWRTRP